MSSVNRPYNKKLPRSQTSNGTELDEGMESAEPLESGADEGEAPEDEENTGGIGGGASATSANQVTERSGLAMLSERGKKLARKSAPSNALRSPETIGTHAWDHLYGVHPFRRLR